MCKRNNQADAARRRSQANRPLTQSEIEQCEKLMARLKEPEDFSDIEPILEKYNK